ncbi:hypothetical protein N510_000156 [Firmicutes bacterium ASF500]|nr:hypothetical protein N510_000156 [Firmicutes bacterium ASF500]
MYRNRVFELQDAASCPPPNAETLRRLRPMIQWGMLLCWGITALAVVLKEWSAKAAVLSALSTAVICLILLVLTRERSELLPTPLRLTMDPDAIVWEFPARPSTVKGRIVVRWEQYTMPRNQITGLYYQAKGRRIEVRGTALSKVWELGPGGELTPCVRKELRDAGLSVCLEKYSPPGTTQRILGALAAYTGKDIRVSS